MELFLQDKNNNKMKDALKGGISGVIEYLGDKEFTG